jgi:hypothetical protein
LRKFKRRECNLATLSPTAVARLYLKRQLRDPVAKCGRLRSERLLGDLIEQTHVQELVLLPP